MDKLIEHNENLDTPVYFPSHLESLKEKHEYFEVPDLETNISRHNNPHYWLQQDIGQIEQFQYRFCKTLYLMKIKYHKQKSFQFLYQNSLDLITN